MPDARVQLAVTIETEGAEQLTTLRRELEQLGQAGAASFERLDHSLDTVVQNLERSRELVGRSTREFLDGHRRLFAGLEPVFDGFFRRLLSGAGSFRDALKRLLSDLLQFFLRTIEQMVGAWLGGFGRMAGGGVGNFLGGLLGGPAGGGILGLAAPLLSSGFGFRVGPGSTAPTFPGGGGGGFSATTLDIFSRLGIPVRDLALGGLTIPGGLLASGGLLGVLGGFQSGSRALGALGGAAAGFAFGGPIGAVIGAVAGFFAGLFGRGKKKRQATRIAEQGFAEMQKVVEQFKKFQLDFESALAQVTALWEQMQAAWRQLGGSIFRRSSSSQQPRFDAIVRELRQIQQAREERARIIESLPIPEFQLGGLVPSGGSRDGRILAFLHPGEAVLNRRAVQTLGPHVVEQLNRAPNVSQPQAAAFGASPVNLTVQVFAARGMDENALANFTLRKLQRALADRGLSLGA